MKKESPIIPLLLIDDNFVTGSQTKTNIFNMSFAEQCRPLKMFLTQSRLNSINFTEDEMLKIKRVLKIYKA